MTTVRLGFGLGARSQPPTPDSRAPPFRRASQPIGFRLSAAQEPARPGSRAQRSLVATSKYCKQDEFLGGPDPFSEGYLESGSC